MGGMTVLYSILFNLLEILRARAHLGSQLMTRRLVMEKILFSEIGAVERRYEEVFGEAVRPEDMESHVFQDVHDTVIFFEVTIPSIIRGVAELMRECYELWIQREKIDVLALARPFIVNTVLEAVNLARWHYIEEKQEIVRLRNRLRMIKAISNMCEGLSDVQVNNMQNYQLKVLDGLIQREVEGRQGVSKYLSMVYETIDNRSLIDFITETYLAHWVMRTRGITHETFTNIRNEILHVVMAGSRLWKQFKRAAGVMDAQYRVIQLLDLEMFSSEAKLSTVATEQPEEFKICRIRSVYFNYMTEGLGRGFEESYPAEELRENKEADEKKNYFSGDENSRNPNDSAVIGELSQPLGEGDIEDQLRISEPNGIILERGRSYLVVGRNRSGKSTLMKVLCRILDPSRMDITLNGRPFHTVERTHLRQMLSYVAQRPFIFEGTIAENIALGRTSAASEQVGKAAELAGVFISELPTSAPNEDSQLARRGRKRMARPWARRPPFLQWIASRAWSLTLAGTHALRKALNTDPDPQDLNLELDYPLLSSKTRERLREQAEKMKKNLAAARLVALSSPTVQSPSEGPLSADDKRKVLEARTSTRGENLSGGFAQSVALARVFLRPEAQIVVLDEAMSQMDSVKRNTHVLPNLFRFVRKHNQTLIIVSHDVPTVAKHVDRIFVMDRGRCVHQGSHAELISKKSPEYLRLLSGRKELNLGEGESKTSFEMIGSHNRPPRHLGGPTAQRMFRGKLT